MVPLDQQEQQEVLVALDQQGQPVELVFKVGLVQQGQRVITDLQELQDQQA